MTQVNDIALFWKEWGADIHSEAGDLLGEDELTTAVILSLFCDARARDDDILPDDISSGSAQHAVGRAGRVRGWWSDTVAPMTATGLNAREDTLNKARVGSRLWLLSREKQLPEVLRRAKDYAEEALQWLLEDKEVRAVSVTATNPRQGWLHLDIVITLPDGERREWAFPYHYI